MMQKEKALYEIRGHARGGQGMVTAFEILAKIFSSRGYEVQAFPFFGVERTGAPIQAFLRISKTQIFNRSNIYEPNLVVVFDEGLLNQPNIFDGLSAGSSALLNSDKQPSFFSEKAKNVFTVPATKISIDKGLGSKALPIVNAAMIGAVLKVLNEDIDAAKLIIRKAVPAKHEANAEAAEIAFNSVLNYFSVQSDAGLERAKKQAASNGSPSISFAGIPATPLWNKPMSLNKTGNWRVQTPEYVDRTPPCTHNCPAGTDVRKFVKLTAENKFKDAYEVIYRHNPFPSVCGRVCPHFCQQNCNRIALDSEVNIGAIERFLGDHNSTVRHKPVPVTHKEKIALIGSGPAGLTAALRLRQKGYATTVFEAHPKAGGMMRTGIPQFRLPEKTLDMEIKKICEQGVKIITGRKVTVKEIEKDFSAVIVAAGSHIGTTMKIENEELAIEGIEFLRDIKFGNKSKAVCKGDVVAVIGGGNTAIDVSRTVLRLGGKPTIYYRRTRQEMPAIAHEVEEALAEGVKIEFLTDPVAVKQNAKNGFKVTMIKMKLGEPDESGRRKPVPIKGSEKNIVADKIIKAIGQTFDAYVFGNDRLKIKQGKIEYPHDELKIPVFCCGDMAWGGTVTEAIGSGNDAAAEVDAFLKQDASFEYSSEAKKNIDVVNPQEINFNYYESVAGHVNPFRKAKKLLGDFNEVMGGLPAGKIAAEANRCLHCGDCYSCGNCFNFCPDAAIHVDEENRLRIDYDYCKGCGICVKECPCSAILFGKEQVESVS